MLLPTRPFVTRRCVRAGHETSDAWGVMLLPTRLFLARRCVRVGHETSDAWGIMLLPTYSEHDEVVWPTVGHWGPLPPSILGVLPPHHHQVSLWVADNMTLHLTSWHPLHIQKWQLGDRWWHCEGEGLTSLLRCVWILGMITSDR